MTRPQNTSMNEMCNCLAADAGNVVRQLLKTTVEDLMRAGASGLCGAAKGKCSAERTISRNRYRARR